MIAYGEKTGLPNILQVMDSERPDQYRGVPYLAPVIEPLLQLYINGKLYEKLDIQLRFYNSGKDSMKYIRTLVFPLQKAGSFKSRITNLKVYNHMLKQ